MLFYLICEASTWCNTKAICYFALLPFNVESSLSNLGVFLQYDVDFFLVFWLVVHSFWFVFTPPAKIVLCWSDFWNPEKSSSLEGGFSSSSLWDIASLQSKAPCTNVMGRYSVAGLRDIWCDVTFLGMFPALIQPVPSSHQFGGNSMPVFFSSSLPPFFLLTL